MKGSMLLNYTQTSAIPKPLLPPPPPPPSPPDIVEENLYGMNNQGNDCWCIAMMQILLQNSAWKEWALALEDRPEPQENEYGVDASWKYNDAHTHWKLEREWKQIYSIEPEQLQTNIKNALRIPHIIPLSHNLEEANAVQINALKNGQEDPSEYLQVLLGALPAQLSATVGFHTDTHRDCPGAGAHDFSKDDLMQGLLQVSMKGKGEKVSDYFKDEEEIQNELVCCPTCDSRKVGLKDKRLRDLPRREEVYEIDQVIKKTLLESPQYLLFHLKRFQVVGTHLRKNNMPIQVERVIKQNEQRYALTGLISHQGNIGGGHYTAYRLVENRWYHCNDSVLTLVSEQAVLAAAKFSYVLNYEKIPEGTPSPEEFQEPVNREVVTAEEKRLAEEQAVRLEYEAIVSLLQKRGGITSLEAIQTKIQETEKELIQADGETKPLKKKLKGLQNSERLLQEKAWLEKHYKFVANNEHK